MGCFVTKDFGENWTEVRIPTIPTPTIEGFAHNQAIPSNNVGKPDYPIIGGATPECSGQLRPGDGGRPRPILISSTSVAITADGDTGLIRVDLTTIWDAHSLVAIRIFRQRRGRIEPGHVRRGDGQS